MELPQVVRNSMVMTFLAAMMARSSGMHLLIKPILISDCKWVQGAGLALSTSVPELWYYCTSLQGQWLRMSKVDGNWSGVHKEGCVYV